VKWESENEPREIFEFFTNPPVSDAEIRKPRPDFDKLKDFMFGFDFSEERAAKTIERLGKTKASGKAESLQKWFG
jgi:hypothetical protein